MQQVRGFFFPEADADRSIPFFEFGAYGAGVRRAAIDACRRFRRAVEVGAHVGLNTRELATRFAAVEAFEPQSQVFDCLAANLADTGVSTHRVALSSHACRGYIGRKAARDSGSAVTQLDRRPGLDPCPVHAVDDYGWTDVDLLRIGLSDVDAVLLGAARTLADSRPVLWLEAAPTENSAAEALLAGLGYAAAPLQFGVLLTAAAPAERLAPSTLLVSDGALGRRLVRLAPESAPLTSVSETVVLNGRAAVAERIGVHVDAGRAELLSIDLEPAAADVGPSNLQRAGAQVPLAPATVDLDSLLKRVRVTFKDGAFRLSAPPETLAYFRDLSAALRRDGGEQVIARFDLRLADNLDDLAVRAPLTAITADPVELVVDLRPPSGATRRLTLPTRFDPAEFTADMTTCYLNRGGGGNPVINAFASSLGARLAYAEDGAREGVAIVWGVLRGSKDVIDAVQARRGHFYYIDHAYFDRGHLKSYRITRNGFEAGPIRECPSDRFAALNVEVQPWRTGGDYILVCPPTDYFMAAHNAHTWLDDTLAQLKALTDRPIVVRLKPQPGEEVVPLAEAMAGAHALVTHSSNVAVEAVVAGTPVFVAPTSAAAPVGRTDLRQIEAPIRPDRAAWLAHLSYSQFSYEEVVSGAAWRLLREFETRPFVKS